MVESGECPPRNAADFRWETSDSHGGSWQFNWPDGTERTVLSGGADGGMTFLLRFPAGYHRADERRRSKEGSPRLEWHTCHEEIFCVEGEIHFGDYYSMTAPAYLNHPPGWVHPADQHSPSGVTLLLKNSAPVEFAYESIPADWDGVEWVTTGSAGDPAAEGVTCRQLSAGPVDEAQVDVLYEWPDGMRTEWWQVPAGWRPESSPERFEMIFVVDGSVDLGDQILYANAYGSGRGLTARASSASGATLIRWCR